MGKTWALFSSEVSTKLCGELYIVSAPSSHLHEEEVKCFGPLYSQHIVDHQYIFVE